MKSAAPRRIASLSWWQRAWLVLAAVSLPLTAYYAWLATEQADRDLRVQLIQRYSLWEADPQYRGTPQAWTRFASFLLNTEQLMERVRAKYGALAEPIELDFRRDKVFAQGRVIVIYLLGWGMPLGVLYAAGLLYERRRARRSA